MGTKTFLTIFATACSIMGLAATGTAAKAGTPEALLARGGLAVNVVEYGAGPDDHQDDTDAVNEAIKVCMTGRIKTLVFPAGTFNLATVMFPKEINVVVVSGALLQIHPDATVRFNGPFSAGLYQVFSNSGKVNFGNAAVTEVYPQWWPSPGGDDSVAIKRAVDSAPDLQGITVRLIGEFNCRTTVPIDRHRVHILGAGIYATNITFDPDSDQVMFAFKMEQDGPLGNKILVQCSIKDLSIWGRRDNPHQKIGIKVVDVSNIMIRDILINSWRGNQSIGLQTQGREYGHVENVTIRADLPISIEKNPNYEHISIDHFVFRNTYLLVDDHKNPAVRIAPGVALFNTVFDGSSAWTTAKYGLYWKDMESSAPSLDLAIKGGEWNKAADTVGVISST